MSYYSRPSQNLKSVGEVLPLFAGLIFTVLVYYTVGDWLFTLAGTVAGMLGVEGYISYVTSRLRSVGAIVGGTVGALVDGYSNFSSAIVGGVLSGDMACMVFLMGYMTIFGVLIFNFVSSGRFVR